MIKFNEAKIKSLYAGEESILKAFIGSSLVFNSITFYTVNLSVDPSLGGGHNFW